MGLRRFGSELLIGGVAVRPHGILVRVMGYGRG